MKKIFSFLFLLAFLSAKTQHSWNKKYISFFGTSSAGNETVQYSGNSESSSWNITVSLATPYFPPLRQSISYSKNSDSLCYRFNGNDVPWIQPKIDSTQQLYQLREIWPFISPTSIGSLAFLINNWNQLGRPGAIYMADSTAANIEVIDSLVAIPGWAGTANVYAINGLSWGKTLVWMDNEKQVALASVAPLVAITTITILDELKESKYYFISSHVNYVFQMYRKKLTFHPEQQDGPKKIIIHNISYWDGLNKKLHAPRTFFIENGIIKKTTTPLAVYDTTNCIYIDGTNQYMFPGLRDMHAHLKQPDWLPAYLATGITTCRELGNDTLIIKSLTQQNAKTNFLMPRLIIAGIIDGVTTRTRFVEAGTRTELEQLVDYYVQNNYHQLKVWNNLSKELFDHTIYLSRKKGLKVSGHVPAAVSFPYALSSGMNEINHIFPIANYLWAHPAEKQKVFKQLVRNKIALDPTLVINEVQTRPRSKSPSDIEPSLDFAPPAIKRLIGHFGMEDSVAHTAIPYRDFLRKLVKQLSALPIDIVAGSDQGVPGYTLIREIELYTEAGISTHKAMQMATQSYPYQALLAEGKAADMVIYNSNPLQNITVLRKPVFTIAAGYIYKSTELSRLVGFNRPD